MLQPLHARDEVAAGVAQALLQRYCSGSLLLTLLLKRLCNARLRVCPLLLLPLSLRKLCHLRTLRFPSAQQL